MDTITALPDTDTLAKALPPKGYRKQGRNVGSRNVPTKAAGRRWRDDELVTLDMLVRRGASTSEIAKVLGRSHVAVAQRRGLHGIGPKQQARA